jgi:hypothetical protein
MKLKPERQVWEASHKSWVCGLVLCAAVGLPIRLYCYSYADVQTPRRWLTGVRPWDRRGSLLERNTGHRRRVLTSRLCSELRASSAVTEYTFIARQKYQTVTKVTCFRMDDRGSISCLCTSPLRPETPSVLSSRYREMRTGVLIKTAYLSLVLRIHRSLPQLPFMCTSIATVSLCVLSSYTDIIYLTILDLQMLYKTLHVTSWK